MTARRSIIPLLCVTAASSTFPIGAFPALLPDLDRVVGLSDVELGALAGAFGFARMAADVPTGIFVTRHLAAALRLAPLMLLAGILVLGSGGPFAALLVARLLMGVAHSIGMVAWLSTILRHQHGAILGASLNAFEFSAMLGMFGGITVMGALPATLGWNMAFLIASAPQIVATVAAPFLAQSVERATGEARPTTERDATDVAPRRMSSRVALAFAAGTALATAYSTSEQFLIPIRGSRDLGLARSGVAQTLMIADASDIVFLLPAGLLADRVGALPLVGVVMLAMAASSTLIGFAGLGGVRVGAALMGLGMAGWMLPLAILRRETAPAHVPWRTALYRVGVDTGLFVGPFAAGLLGRHARVLPIVIASTLAVLAAIAFGRVRASAAALAR